MKIGVIGTGYVGLVVGACLAEVGNHLICGDIDVKKIAALNQGRIPIYEPGLEPLVKRNLEAGRLHFTSEIPEVVKKSKVIFIAVGTPPNEDGSADLAHVLDVARVIGQSSNGEKIVVTKSTVPVGTATAVRQEIEKWTEETVHVCSNPEFLKEGMAVEDFMKPDRVILGVDSPAAERVMVELYEPFVRTGNPVMVMDIPSAELAKYVANAMLATRISFMNEVAVLCEHAGADVSKVRLGVGSDRRIGPTFLFPGPGFGGSCFPKDIRALAQTAQQYGCDMQILRAVEEVNERQKRFFLHKIDNCFGADLEGKTVAVWGLAFKPGTDDIRESPAIVLIEGLLMRGACVRCHDPVALKASRKIFGSNILYSEGEYEALEDADALVVMTDWLEYRRPDFGRMKTLMKQPIIFDARNLYRARRLKDEGFKYYPLGRKSVE
jgi:UDPglucose 6-dehydrogenase